MKRGTPLERKTPLKAKKPVRKRNPDRRKKEWRRAYHSVERVEWVKARPSVADGAGPCENAHIETGGMGRKADYDRIVPLTAAQHRELHAIGVRPFETKYQVDLDIEATVVEIAWREHMEGLA